MGETPTNVQQFIDKINTDALNEYHAAIELGMHVNTVARHVKSGRIPAFRIGQNVMIWRSDIEEIKAARP